MAGGGGGNGIPVRGEWTSCSQQLQGMSVFRAVCACGLCLTRRQAGEFYLENILRNKSAERRALASGLAPEVDGSSLKLS